MGLFRSLFRRPPPPPDIEGTLDHLRQSRAVLADHTATRQRDAATMRLEQTILRRKIREMHPLETAWFADGEERRP